MFLQNNFILNLQAQSIQDNRQFMPHSFESKVSSQPFDSIPQGFTIKKPILMTEALVFITISYYH